MSTSAACAASWKTRAVERHPDRARRGLYLRTAAGTAGVSGRPLRARATLRLAAVVAAAVTLLSLAGMALQYRLVEARLMEAQRALLPADLDGLAALYDQRRIIALRAGDRLSRGRGHRRRNASCCWTGRAPGWRAPATTGPARWPPKARSSPPPPRGSSPKAPPAGSASRASCRAASPCSSPVRWPGRRHPRRPARAGCSASVGAARCGGAVGWLAARGVMGRIDRINALADRVAEGESGRPAAGRAQPPTNSACSKPMCTPCWTGSRT